MPDPKPISTARNLSILAYAQGFTHWHYNSEASVTEILLIASDFFLPLCGTGDGLKSNLICPGDILLLSCPDGAAQFWVSRARAFRIMCHTEAPANGEK